MTCSIHIALHHLSIRDLLGAEWLDTNGAGGWASSSLLNCNTRRYHGYLIAAAGPPLQRFNMVADLEESMTLSSSSSKYLLSCHDYGDGLFPAPFSAGQAVFFHLRHYPEWRIHVQDVVLVKTLITVHQRQTTIIRYLLQEGTSLQLHIRPLIAARDYHALQHASAPIQQAAEWQADHLKVQPFPGLPVLRMGLTDGAFHPDACWYFHLHYAQETERGMDDREDLFSYGIWTAHLQKGEPVYLVLTTDAYPENPAESFAAEIRRREQALANSFSNDAAHHFLIHQQHVPAILAGYPWFTEWGRDTLIAVNGLCTYNGNPKLARQIITQYAHQLAAGMLPNFFPDGAQEPCYNTVDAALWFVIAVHHYWQLTHDEDFLREMIPAVQDIWKHYRQGTRYQIHETESGLLFAGEDGWQLTWMDARTGDRVVTPRIGMPVEVNALWYNLKCLLAEWLYHTNQHQEAQHLVIDAERTLQSFRTLFWNPAGQCLHDVLTPEGPDASVRPNQLFALSLPYPLVEIPQALHILQVVREKLYTPKGLRSLAPDDPAYQGIYAGPPEQRDAAYHQGTVWLYLIGAYVDALIRYLPEGKLQATLVMNRLLTTLAEQGLLTLGEIADGDSPHLPRGCIAQAWSVGELIRVIKQYQLPVQSSFCIT
ncbi:amylo-alpha-1,6-glucosidase [Thermoflavifilum thermophilum]|uniref:amylo-alpha-1,6-glucosidase n=1 Tax=Thermoflavifilum thermophilum TaxID=1393122 RepID=UPI0011609611|nr:amylo-alpha-1,6-glucosidase [Thermoflavifilum thermophilum]